MSQDASISHPARAGVSLTLLLSAALVALCAGVYWSGGGSLESVRLIDRLMARFAVVFFSIGFVASDWVPLHPGGLTRWIWSHRRTWAISFAVAFGLHLCAIARFYRLDAGLFWSVSPPVLIALRGIGVGFIVLILINTFKNGRELWRRLSGFGGYYVWAAFFSGFVKRVPQSWIYLLPVTLLVLVLVVKLAEGGLSRRPRPSDSTRIIRSP